MGSGACFCPVNREMDKKAGLCYKRKSEMHSLEIAVWGASSDEKRNPITDRISTTSCRIETLVTDTISFFECF